MFFEFRWISPLSLKFPEIFSTIYLKLLKFPEYFLKNFTLKICLNIAWICYECTKNVLRISYKFFRNFRTVHKISLKRLEYLINFLKISFSKVFRTFPNNPAEIFKTSFKLYLQNFYINTSIGWTVPKLYENLSKISNQLSWKFFNGS